MCNMSLAIGRKVVSLPTFDCEKYLIIFCIQILKFSKYFYGRARNIKIVSALLSAIVSALTGLSIIHGINLMFNSSTLLFLRLPTNCVHDTYKI